MKKKEASHMAICDYCEEFIWFDGITAWVDFSDGDVCSGNDELVNENQPHIPGLMISNNQWPV